MSAFVPDASVTLPWCFEDERTPYTQALLASLAGGYVAKVPSHWPIELLNALIQAKKRRRVSDAQIRSFLINLFSLPIGIDSELGLSWMSRCRDLSEKHGLTAYDAAYLELAQRLDLPLATLDKELIKAAKAEGTVLAPMPS